MQNISFFFKPEIILYTGTSKGQLRNKIHLFTEGSYFACNLTAFPNRDFGTYQQPVIINIITDKHLKFLEQSKCWECIRYIFSSSTFLRIFYDINLRVCCCAPEKKTVFIYGKNNALYNVSLTFIGSMFLNVLIISTVQLSFFNNITKMVVSRHAF